VINNEKVLAFVPQFNDLYSTLKLNSNERSAMIPIPHAQAEVESISSILDTKILSNDQATEEAFKLLSTNYGIIHLATHGLINDKHPLDSKILFAKNKEDSLSDGILYSHEILNMEINAEMVVLSACNTGIGEINEGEGALSLASSFFYSGAKSVVMSQWPANDLSTSKLMGSFYTYLDQGMTKSAALRQAKLDYIRDESKIVTHPYFWSQFVIYGKNAPVKRDTGNSTLVYMLMAAMTFLVGTFFLVKRQYSKKLSAA
ncbi:MAG: CHAT domain-containing protein, partial [Bacteroidota bacterium]